MLAVAVAGAAGEAARSEVVDAMASGDEAAEVFADGAADSAAGVDEGDVADASSSRCLISAALRSSASRCDSLLVSFTFLRPAISVATCLSCSFRSAANRLNIKSPRNGS